MAVRSAAVGAILLALIEGIGICITRMTAEQFKPGSSSSFGSVFRAVIEGTAMSQNFIKIITVGSATKIQYNIK